MTRDRTGQCTLHSQHDGQNGHERLIGDGINDGPNNGLLIPAAGDPTIDKIREASVSE